MLDYLKNLQNQKYLALETFKKNGDAVKTPVWFVIKNNLIYIVTREDTGKIKRLKNNKKVRLAPSNFKGNPIGDWVFGTVNFSSEDETKEVITLRRKKYGFLERIAQFASKSKGNLFVFSVDLEES